MNTNLELIFNMSGDEKKTFTLVIKDCKSNVTRDECDALAQKIIDQQFFKNASGVPTSLKKVQLRKSMVDQL